MSDEAPLLRAICESPADDTARLVFADYLQERGGNVDTAWAYLVRGQVELAQTNAETGATASRVRVLNVPFWHAQWFARLVPEPAQLQCDLWVRGFPVSIGGDAATVLARWPELVSRVPFERLILRAATDELVEELTTRPELSRVRTLRLETTFPAEPLTDRTFRALAACEHLTELGEVSGHSFTLTDEGAEALVTSLHLAKLRVLVGYALYGHRHRTTVSAELRTRLNERFGTFALY